jgi:CBS domain-containing protein
MEITRRMATYDMVAMPVVDNAYRLVGAVTVDDVLDHSLPRDWRDRDVPVEAEQPGLLPAAAASATERPEPSGAARAAGDSDERPGAGR